MKSDYLKKRIINGINIHFKKNKRLNIDPLQIEHSWHGTNADRNISINVHCSGDIYIKILILN